MSSSKKKTLVQCDFDGTVTMEDVSYMLLDVFADGNWRLLLKEYEQGKISVGQFNRQAFAMVKADRQTMLAAANARMETRPGFREFVDVCRRKGFPLLIISNGLDFYIEGILKWLNLEAIEVHAALTEFSRDGLRVQYIGPDGQVLENNLKEAYIDLFLASNYRVVYIGNGVSDLAPSRKAHQVFATGDLPNNCQRAGVQYTAFTNFYDVIRGIELL